MEKAREFQKNICFCFIDYAKAFDCVNHNKLWKILQEMGHQTTHLSQDGYWGSPGGSVVKNPPAMQETPVRFLGWEDPMEKGKATHSSILA